MIRHLGPEPPWSGRCRMSGRVLWWVKGEQLWDGTDAWYLQDVRQPSIFEMLMKRLSPISALTEKVRWLEDDLLVTKKTWVPS